MAQVKKKVQPSARRDAVDGLEAIQARVTEKWC